MPAPHDCDAQMAIQAENLAEVPPQILDVVSDAPNAKLTEIGQVLANLGGIQVELFGKGLG